jgi:P-type Mg2+ transporter
MLGAVIFLPFLPMLPIQILLNNSLYDLSQLTIPLDTVDDQYIQKPYKWDIHFLQKAMLAFGPISSLFDFITFFVLSRVFRLPEIMFQSAWFLESILTQVLVIYVIRSQKSIFKQTLPSKWLVLNSVVIILIAFSLPYTQLGDYFGLHVLSTEVYLSILAIVASYLMIMSIIKMWFYNKLIKN